MHPGRLLHLTFKLCMPNLLKSFFSSLFSFVMEWTHVQTGPLFKLKQVNPGLIPWPLINLLPPIPHSLLTSPPTQLNSRATPPSPCCHTNNSPSPIHHEQCHLTLNSLQKENCIKKFKLPFQSSSNFLLGSLLLSNSSPPHLFNPIC